ncbi:hypothetical protein N802_18110 [Knoellia sinensis KCTC 19936]|uniref:Uncharacterized protein n=1 Tax=Knoellia sinensis KCTC 19936 TaxID=1385520 RepID=A0A0A0J4Y7_9MICO|nr:hypothetical protein [Knoellia sinensis]KGN32278.1 hypothetical protein N802_18110 [Knoellia sinensis KCTC 19936]
MPTETDTDFLVWGARVFALLALLGVAAILAAVWWVIVRPVIAEALRAREAGDWWLPFLPQSDGGYGPLAENHWWSAMRAPQPGSSGGLLIRWGFWTMVSIGLTLGMARAVWQLARLVVRAWS